METATPEDCNGVNISREGKSIRDPIGDLSAPQRRPQELPRGVHVPYLRKQGPEKLEGCTRLHWAGTTMSTWRGGDDNLEPQVQAC